MAIKRRSVIESIPSINCYMDYDYELYTRDEKVSCCQRYRCCLIAVTTLLLLLVLAFIVIFVVPPVTFMLSIGVQRYVIFLATYGNESGGFTNFKEIGLEGLRNLYVPVDHNVTLGVWHVLPLEYTYEAVTSASYNYDDALADGKYPVLLYLHDSGENRITSKNKYMILRRFFHVIAFDYRSYGDSTDAELSEGGLVHDSANLYRWTRTHTGNDAYVWGHGLGSSIAAKTVAQLRNESIVPKGLFLESAFTNLEELLTVNSYMKIFSWTPWFKPTFLDSLRENEFLFKTDEYILSVDCPIMIVHAEDNHLIPYTQSEKLVRIGNKKRVNEVQGNITFHLFPKNDHYGHNDIYLAPQLPEYIRSHIDTCNEYNKGKG
ncbi:lysophosphatidylserine lipase ABHD12-like [Photinus pyralis]|uniref:lysophosphatidylserine lipase ABHD12-like n=1 Tax=Photinus pyralis TaxID=7054 RepID=UPI0012674427|nr:lysophosphatidylserine lipase ABHD12-like [Photinus pyralis]XP_031357778.1 lysophosphatidylserine lipase ABHD12-like [Photinus pyralis]